MDRTGDQPSSSSFFGRDDDDVDENLHPAPRRRGFFRRHKALTVLTALAAVAVLAIGMVALYINNEIGDIPAGADLGAGARRTAPAAPTGRYAKSMNILLAGADNGDDQGDSIAETVAKGAGRPGIHRSDTSWCCT